MVSTIQTVTNRESSGSFGGGCLHATIRAAMVAALALWTNALGPAQAQPMEWILRSQSGPSPRYGHAMAYDSTRGVTVLFGGRAGTYNHQTWEWDGANWTNRVVSAPTARIWHAMAYDSARGVTVLFGGHRSLAPFYNSETWEWDGAVWTRRMVSGPSGRDRHAMAYDSVRGVTVLYGGRTSLTDWSDETWEWDGAVWSLRATGGPGTRYGHAMAYDSARGVTILFGGVTAYQPPGGETWEWSGTIWRRRAINGPSSFRYGHAMAYDSARGVIVLFGGDDTSNNFSYNDTWDFNGATWTRWAVSGPSARSSHAMIYDVVRGVTVLFGGVSDSVPTGDTWLFSGSCIAPFIVAQPVAQTVCAGSPAHLTVDADGSGDLSFQWWKGSSIVVDEPNHVSGASATRLDFVNTTVADSGSYNCVVTNACGSVESEAATLSVCDYVADLNCDGQVGISDLTILLSNFGRTDGPQRTDGDLDGDETVSLADLAIMLNAFGESCP